MGLLKTNSALFSALCLLGFITLVSSCSSTKTLNKEFVYFQSGLDTASSLKPKERIIQTNDLLGLQFFSKSINQDQVTLFNIPNSGPNGAAAGYLVDIAGNIEIPLIGKVKAAGLTKTQLQDVLLEKLSSYVKDPSVLIRFMQFKVNVMGEVKTPGLHSFETDRVTVIDALSAAGDLTDDGKRDNILVIREDSAQRKYYRVNLTNGQVFKSPAYQLQPNDIVYVSASDKKLVEVSRRVPNDNLRGWQFAISLISVASSVLFVTYTITK